MNALTHATPSGRLVLFLLFSAVILLPVSVEAQAKLSVTPTLLKVQTNAGTNAPSQTVRISNAGKGSLKWSVVNLTTGWLRVSPTGGVNTGTLTLTLSTSTLTPSQYLAWFTVDSNGGRIRVDVELTVVAAALTVTCPSNMSVASPDGLPVAVNYSVTTSGGVAPVTVTGSPESGSGFPVGTTPVKVIARSSDGQEKSCAFSVTVTYSPDEPPTGVGPQPTIACPADAFIIFPNHPGYFIPSIVNSHPPGTTFCLKAGVHSLDRSITPRSGDTYVGEYGAVLDGAGWSTPDDTEAAFRAYEQDIDNVTIRNLVIRNLRRGIQASGAAAERWTIEYNEVGPNYSGIVFPSRSKIKNNYIHHNDFSGYMAVAAHDSVIENNEVAYNGWEQKVGLSSNVTFRNNFFHHNAGGGIWYDSDNTGALVEGNRIEDNGWIGIFYEISSDAIIRNNILRRNGDAGVMLGTSKNVQIYNNTFDNNFRGITYFVYCAAIGGGSIGFDLANNSSHDNVFLVGAQSGALASVFSYSSCTSTQLAAYQNGAKNLTFSHNSYDVPSPATGQVLVLERPQDLE